MSYQLQNDSVGLRVTLISGSYPYIKCGVGDFTEQLANALAELAVDVHVITSTGAAQPTTGKVKVHTIVNDWTRRSLSPILDALRKINPHVVNVQYPTQQYGRHLAVNFLPWVISTRLHIPTVVSIHEFSSFTSLGRLRLTMTAKLSQAVIVTNSFEKSLLRAWIGPSPSITLIPIGSSIPILSSPGFERSELRQKLGVAASSIVLAFFGQISPSKGLDTLLDAFSIACTQQPELDLRLWILADRESSVPDFNAYHASFASRLKELPQSNRVFWSGYLSPDALSNYLQAVDVGVLPFDDGASLRRSTLIAMLSHGLPVLSTDGRSTGGNQLGDSQGLSLVPPHNAQALAEQMLHLATNPALRAALRAKAQVFSRQFSWPDIAKQTRNVYQQLLPAG